MCCPKGRAQAGEQYENVLMGEPHVLAAPRWRVRGQFRVATTGPGEHRPRHWAQGRARTRQWALSHRVEELGPTESQSLQGQVETL